MSMVRYFSPENTLEKAIALPGGKPFAEAVSAAAAGLVSVSDKCLARTDEALSRIDERGRGKLCEGAVSDLYRDAREIAGLAAHCGLSDLGEAARSFCAFLDRAGDCGDLRPEHVRLYIDVMRSLRRADGLSETERAEVLVSLGEVVGKVGGSPRAG